jgi:hypothetical protein
VKLFSQDFLKMSSDLSVDIPLNFKNLNGPDSFGVNAADDMLR